MREICVKNLIARIYYYYFTENINNIKNFNKYKKRIYTYFHIHDLIERVCCVYIFINV